MPPVRGVEEDEEEEPRAKGEYWGRKAAAAKDSPNEEGRRVERRGRRNADENSLTVGGFEKVLGLMGRGGDVLRMVLIQAV